MKIALWIVQGLLALSFIMAGLMKLVSPIEDLADAMVWVGRYSEGIVRFIGLMELLGGVGVILPSILRIQPKLAPAAAGGLLIIMILASIDHIRADEMADLIPALVTGALAAFVLWGRWKKAPIEAK